MRVLALAGIVIIFIAGLRYPDNPPPAHTGGFGERTCHFCHFENDINAPGGRLSVQGLENGYEPGEANTLAVRFRRDGMQRSGFQLSVRYAGGNHAGQQAGLLEPTDERATVDTLNGVQYIRHTRAGTQPLSPDSTVWILRWIAPSSGETVALHLAANAANGDASEFGDSIYLLERTVPSKP